MSALMQTAIFAETSPVVTVLGQEQINQKTTPTSPTCSNPIAPNPVALNRAVSVASSPVAAKTASTSLFRSEQRLAYRDLIISACIGSATAAIAAILGILSVSAACSFALGSLVAYAIAAHRILALTPCDKL